MDIFSIMILILLFIIALLLANISEHIKNIASWLSYIMTDVESLRDKLAPFDESEFLNNTDVERKKQQIRNKTG